MKPEMSVAWLDEDRAGRLAKLVADEQSFVTNALYVFARRMDDAAVEAEGAGGVGVGELPPGALVTAVGFRQAAGIFRQNAEKARRLAKGIEEIVEPDEEEDDEGDRPRAYRGVIDSDGVMETDRRTYILSLLDDATADRPAHKKLLGDLIDWRAAGCPGGSDAEPHDSDGRKGVSFEVYCALAGDVGIAFTDQPSRQLYYPALRAKYSQAAAKRADAKAGPSGTGLENLIVRSEESIWLPMKENS